MVIFDGICLDLVIFDGIYWDFTGIYWFLMGFTGILLGVTDFLMGFTGIFVELFEGDHPFLNMRDYFYKGFWHGELVVIYIYIIYII